MSYTILTNNDNRLEIKIRRIPAYNIVIFTGFCMAVCTGIALFILIGVIKYPYKLNEKVIILLFLLISTGLYMLKLFLWHLLGKEQIIIQANELLIRKRGTILSVPRRYELRFSVNFISTSLSPYPWWMRKFGIAGGQIEFQYLGSPRYFGQTLDLVQAQAIADLINNRIFSYIQPAPDVSSEQQ